jgi:large subunit ribosomal protein L4
MDTKAVAEVPAEIFDVQTNVPLIHQVVVAQLAAARQGTHKTKTRGEVAGGGAKPWRQKGTGRARQGSRRAPQWVGGGTVHGPQPRSYAQRTPKKMIQAALKGALSDRARDERLHIISEIVGEKISTKEAVKALGDLYGNKLLVVLTREEDAAWMSLRNVPTVHPITVDQLNTYDVLDADDIVFTKAAYTEFTGVEIEDKPKAEKKTAKKAKSEGAEEKPKKKAAKPKAEKAEDKAEAEEPKAEAEAEKTEESK